MPLEGSDVRRRAASGAGSDPDDGLMLAVRAGDVAAFGELVRRHQDRVVRLAYRYLGSVADAEDLAQDVFLRVHRARESWTPSARVSTWLHRITVNCALNALRARRARRAVNGEMPGTGDPQDAAGPDAASGQPGFDAEDPRAADPADRLEKDEFARALRGIVDGLPERQRTAILLNKYEDLPYEDVAAAMELSVSAVKSLLTRARVTIRDELLRRGLVDVPDAPDPSAPPGNGSGQGRHT